MEMRSREQVRAGQKNWAAKGGGDSGCPEFPIVGEETYLQ